MLGVREESRQDDAWQVAQGPPKSFQTWLSHAFLEVINVRALGPKTSDTQFYWAVRVTSSGCRSE